jgi:hypothetical protein
MLLGVFEELLHAIHIAVIGDGKGRHPQLIGPVEEVFYGGLSVQDGVLGVDVQVNKTHETKIRILPENCAKKLSTMEHKKSARHSQASRLSFGEKTLTWRV